MNNAPDRIVVCTDGHKPAIADWAKDKMKPCDAEYVRADLVPPVPPSTSAAIRAAAEEIREWLRGDGHVDGEAINELSAILSRWFGKGETDWHPDPKHWQAQKGEL